MNDFEFDLDDYEEDDYVGGDDGDDYVDNDSDSLSGFNDFSDDEDNTDNDNADDRKRLTIIACMGAFILVLVFTVAGALLSSKSSKNYSSVSTEAVSIDNQHSGVDRAFDNTSVSSNWVDIVPDKSVTFGDDISGIFTVTSIKYLAKQSGNETITKAVATGSISGLSGTYEIELPYHLAVDVNIGNSFELYYKLGNIDGKSIVSLSRIK